ncbi:MAG: NifB/NifX family molybdenum-iron cluster-binding protein [Gammaproteobacteria bacterium]|nr:NifB/NifX family molybdenum-iron cluster-binding protein [Gammaproteobacteria bacterium]
MKIAIAATSQENDAQIAMQGARTPYYLFLDTEHDLFETLPNPASGVERGAGQQAAAFLRSKGVVKVVAGDFGPKFRAELEGSGIICTEMTGTISKITAEISR